MSPRNWSRVPVAVLLLGMLAVAGCERKQEVATEVRPVKTQLVKLQPLASESSYSGEVRARYETRLAFRVGGKVTARLVEVGQEVKAGQLLARLDPQDLQLSVMAKRAQRDAVLAAFAEDDWWFHTFARGYMPWVAYGFGPHLTLQATAFLERRDGIDEYTDRYLLDLRSRW